MAKQDLVNNESLLDHRTKLNAMLTELYAFLGTKGIANGLASLNSSGVIPASQLPSYVDDVLEFANLAAFPATGESGKIYVAIDSNFAYRWAGSVYVRIDQVDLSGYATTAQLAAKQNTLTFDNSPASGSNNPVTSQGIYAAILAAITGTAALQKTGGSISFEAPAVYNDNTNYTGAITIDTTQAVYGTQILFRSFASSAPGNIAIKGGNQWNPGQENLLLITYVGTGTPWGFIFSMANTAGVVTELTPRATEDTQQDQTTAKPIVGLSGLTIPAGSWGFEVYIFHSAASSAATGAKFALNVTNTVAAGSQAVAEGFTTSRSVSTQSPLALAGTLGGTAYGNFANAGTGTNPLCTKVIGRLELSAPGVFDLSLASNSAGVLQTALKGSFGIFKKNG